MCKYNDQIDHNSLKTILKSTLCSLNEKFLAKKCRNLAEKFCFFALRNSVLEITLFKQKIIRD